MIQITPQMRVLVAIEAADFRRGIDGLAQLCRATLHADPFSGVVFAFRNRRRTAIKLLVYDGQGFWLCHKRLSKGTFRWWPSSEADAAKATLQAHEPPGPHLRWRPVRDAGRAGVARRRRVAISRGAWCDQPCRSSEVFGGCPLRRRREMSAR